MEFSLKFHRKIFEILFSDCSTEFDDPLGSIFQRPYQTRGSEIWKFRSFADGGFFSARVPGCFRDPYSRASRKQYLCRAVLRNKWTFIEIDFPKGNSTAPAETARLLLLCRQRPFPHWQRLPGRVGGPERNLMDATRDSSEHGTARRSLSPVT